MSLSARLIQNNNIKVSFILNTFRQIIKKGFDKSILNNNTVKMNGNEYCNITDTVV